MAKSQIRWFAIGSVFYLFFAGLDYRYLKKWTWILYVGILVMLFGLFLFLRSKMSTGGIDPGVNFAFQPSEYAKLIVVMTLSLFLENKATEMYQKRATFKAILIVIIPFLLILKQPDLGTALVLYPIALVMFYFGGISKKVISIMSAAAIAGLIFISMMFFRDYLPRRI